METARAKLILIIAIILAIPVLFFSCKNKTNKICEYTSNIYEFENGEIGAKLIGSFTSIGNTSIKGSPYWLLLSYKANKKQVGKVSISNIEIQNKNDIILSIKGPFIEDIKEYDENRSWALIDINNVYLEYLNYIVKFNIEIKTSEFNINKKIEIKFKKNYQEYKSNSFWDRLMGV